MILFNIKMQSCPEFIFLKILIRTGVVECMHLSKITDMLHWIMALVMRNEIGISVKRLWRSEIVNCILIG